MSDKTKTIRLDNEPYVFSPLTMQDLKDVRDRVVETKKKYAAEHRDDLLADAKKLGDIEPLKMLEYLHRPMTEEEIDEAMDTPDSIAFTAYLSLKHHHQKIVESNVRDLITVLDIEKVSDYLAGPKKEPVIEVSMKVLGYSVTLEGGRKITINELIADANKKKRKTKAKK